MVLRLRLLLFFAIRPSVNQVRRDDVIPAPADHSLELIGHFEPDPRRITGLCSLLLHHIQKPLPNPVETHVEYVCAALRRDQGQVDCILQPGRRLLPNSFQSFNRVAFTQLLLDPVNGAGRRVVRAQPLRRGVIEDVDQQGAALVGRARG
ncbi:hypothetical protein D3C84_859290 [compost metagenome]